MNEKERMKAGNALWLTILHLMCVLMSSSFTTFLIQNHEGNYGNAGLHLFLAIVGVVVLMLVRNLFDGFCKVCKENESLCKKIVEENNEFRKEEKSFATDIVKHYHQKFKERTEGKDEQAQ